MKKVINKINNISISSKLFLITSSLLIGISIIIYSILYYSLPSYYEKYKLENLNLIISDIKDYSLESDKDGLINYLHYRALNDNVIINLYDINNTIIYGKHNISFNYKKPIKSTQSFNKFEDNFTIILKDNDSYLVNIIMPLQPINEASVVFKKIMPSIITIALLISFIGAYIYSISIAKPLMNIINMEREQENKRKQFVATISHELKTPITIISGQLEGMIYNIGKYKDRDTYLKKTYDITNELKELVNEMMEVSKAEMLEDNLNITSLDLNSLIKDIVTKQSFLIEDKSLNTNINLNSSKEVFADKDKIARAITNIINNAIKYSPKNESIYISTKNDSSGTILTIKNIGVTIPEKDIPNLFNPFFRVEQSRSRKTGGSGLGLYITSQILKAHNYVYTIDNSDNSVVFTILIPNKAKRITK